MKRNKKNLACLTLALGLVFSAGVLPYSAHALEKNDKRVEVSYTHKREKTQKQQGKKVNVSESKKVNGVRKGNSTGNSKSKDDWITYPEYLGSEDDRITYPEYPGSKDDWVTYPEYEGDAGETSAIIDKEEAYEYLSSILKDIPKYKLDKHRLKVEETKSFTSASGIREWYFAYGPKKGKFVASKYFAIDENGLIFEYNAKKGTWSPLMIPLSK